MSFAMRRRRRWPRHALRLLILLVLLGVTTTLAAALQVRRFHVEGVHRFPVAEVERTLRSALGTPTLTARPDALRDAVLALPWVAGAQVRISLDGVVSCTVSERTPVAVGVDGGVRSLLDAEGHALGPAGNTVGLLELDGFGAFPDGRAAVLANVAALASNFGSDVRRVVRLGPRDVEITFAGYPGTVLADPRRPAAAADARRVLAAWTAASGSAPSRLDARVVGRVAVLPAVEPPAPPTDAETPAGSR